MGEHAFEVVGALPMRERTGAHGLVPVEEAVVGRWRGGNGDTEGAAVVKEQICCVCGRERDEQADTEVRGWRAAVSFYMVYKWVGRLSHISEGRYLKRFASINLFTYSLFSLIVSKQTNRLLNSLCSFRDRDNLGPPL